MAGNRSRAKYPRDDALDAYRRTEMVSAGAISSDSGGSTSSGPKDVYATDRNSYTNAK
jgi:hypothetical protein